MRLSKELQKNSYDYLGKNILLTVLGTAAVPLFFFVPIIVLFIDIPWLGPALFFLKATGIMNFMAWVVETIDRRLHGMCHLFIPLFLSLHFLQYGEVTIWLQQRAALNGKKERLNNQKAKEK